MIIHIHNIIIIYVKYTYQWMILQKINRLVNADTLHNGIFHVK